ncbi:MAG TPA: hypothetical protein VJI68_01840 [Candidatus Nanoarchaeia archaeon]|nr:hypothetical protein [Candidatus Nanoarchaeia archaeon]
MNLNLQNNLFYDKVISAWDVNIYVNLDSAITAKIRKLIFINYRSFNLAQQKIGISRKTLSSICQGNFTNVANIFKIKNFFALNNNYVERHIEYFRDSKTGAYNRTYLNIFPVKISPIMIRIVTHLIGDGSVYPGRLWYGQKSELKYFNSLIHSLLKPIKKLNINSYYKQGINNNLLKFHEMNLPMIFGKLVINFLDINLLDLKKHVYIEKLLLLPKLYRVQALAALYVDEGSISTKTIRMKDKEIVESIGKLMDTLNYPRSEVTKSFDDCYGISMHSEGFIKFYDDINYCIKKYKNNALGLWHKNKFAKAKVDSIDISLLKSKKESELLRVKILDILKNREFIYFYQLREMLKIGEDRLYYLLNCLIKRQKVTRLSYGKYSLR